MNGNKRTHLAKHDIGQAAADESLNEILNYIQRAIGVYCIRYGRWNWNWGLTCYCKSCKGNEYINCWSNNATFSYEGPKRMRRAIAGLEVKKHLDTTIVVPNQNLFKITNEGTG